jgi:hypothetical protein
VRDCSRLRLIVTVVEKTDFPHARARVRYHLTRFYGKGGEASFGVLCAQRGTQGRQSPRRGPNLEARATAHASRRIEREERVPAKIAAREALELPLRIRKRVHCELHQNAECYLVRKVGENYTAQGGPVGVTCSRFTSVS